MRLSIIVPVYKAEKTIQKCIDSILSQPFGNWELILVDDGSPDSSGKICDEYAGVDKRIKVIHTANKGVSAARNRGLEIVTGDYVTFIDSDDWIEGDCFSLIEQSVSDLIVFESISYKSNGTKKYWYRIEEKEIHTSEDIRNFIHDFINVFVLDGPCAKFFRRNVIDTLRFPVGQPLGEDNVFMLSYITRCKSIGLRKGVYYVIDDHYDGDFDKYRMSAIKSLECLENIMKAYKGLNMVVPSFENRMFLTFFMVIDHQSDYGCWYNSQMIKDLENRFLRSESRSFRLLYNSCRYSSTRHIGHLAYSHYIKIRRLLSSVVSNK